MNTRERALELLQNIIRINSMNPSLTDDGEGESELAEYLGEYFQNLGLDVDYIEAEGRKSVFATLRGKGDGKTLILNAHTDTVGVEGMEEPLKPVVKDGRVFGRGAYDMKGGLVSSVLAITSIVEEDLVPAGDVIFAGVTDEEFASLGTEALVENYTADAAIICEPTDMRIVIANKGFSWIKIEIEGKAAHGSKPHLGIDAIDKARKVMNEIAKLQDQLNEHTHPLVGTPAIRVSKIEGGLGLSTVPDKCTLYLERRTLPHVKVDQVREEIENILARVKAEDPEFEADFEMIIFRGGLELSEEEEIVKIIADEHRQQTGLPTEFSGEPWWMDSALMGEHGIPTVVLGPTGDGAHAKIEYVELDSVVELAEILKNTIVKYCN